MRIVDYKDPSLLRIWLQRVKYFVLDSQLRRCSSLKDQKAVLRDYYAENSFKRDELLARQYALKNNKNVGLKELVFCYKDFLIAFFASLLTVYLGTPSEDFTFSFSNPTIKVLLTIFVAIIVACLSAQREKDKYIQKDIPLQEIFDLELFVVEQALAFATEDIDYDELIEIYNHRLKTKRRLKHRINVVVKMDNF